MFLSHWAHPLLRAIQTASGFRLTLGVLVEAALRTHPGLGRTFNLGATCRGSDITVHPHVGLGAHTQIGSGSRNRRFAAPAVLEALDEYARGIARRT